MSDDLYEDSQDAERRREHVRLILMGAALTVIVLALIAWGAVGCQNYNQAGIECVKRGDTLINGNCIPRSK